MAANTMYIDIKELAGKHVDPAMREHSADKEYVDVEPVKPLLISQMIEVRGSKQPTEPKTKINDH